jgi:F-type H+-transporting ATPase subunit b
MLASLKVLASEAPNGKFLPGDIKEFWWGTLAFAIVFGLLIWKLLPLVKEAVNKGQAAAVAEATAAEQAIADARVKIAEATEQLGDANAQSERVVADAEEAAQQLRVDSANRTQQMVNDMWAKAQSDVESMKAQASSDIQAEVAAQAVGAAEQIVHASLDEAGHNDLIDSYIAGLGAST